MLVSVPYILYIVIGVAVIALLMLIIFGTRKLRAGRQKLHNQNQPVKVRCLSCNELNDDGDKFCARCGSALK
jgi:uncharacterized paraquat-inducible protein A